MEISESVLKSAADSINDSLLDITSFANYTNDSEKIIELVESMIDLWQTSGGRETVKKIVNEALELDSNQLSSEFSHLSDEKVNYSIHVVENGVSKQYK